MNKRNIAYILVFAAVGLFIYHAYAGDLPKWFIFNRKAGLKEWQEKVFKNKVLYTVETERQGGYLLAKSQEACSGLFYKINFSPKEFPMISWQWNVVKFPDKNASIGGDAQDGWVERDDYAARVYVIFPSMNFRKTKCIEYIWDQDLAEGTMMTSPYFKNIKLIIVESGNENAGKWVFEKRNIYEDYKKVFGNPPSARVGAVALMTDTDNTLSTAEALYKDIKVGYKDGEDK